MSRDKNPAILAKLGDAPLGGAGQQRKRERTCDGDDGGDSDAESAGKRTHSGAGGEEGTEVGRGRSDERSKDVNIHEVGLHQAGAAGVTNEDIMRVLRSIKDSLPGLNALRNPNLPLSGAVNLPVPSNSTSAAHGQHTWLAQESAGPSTLPSASEEALGALLKSGRDLPLVPPQGKGDAYGDKMTDDPRIGQIGDLTDDSHWDSLDADSVEEVFKEMWAAMHPTIALAEGEDEPAGASTDGGKKTSKHPLTLQAKKKYIRRNVKVALDGVRAKLQVLGCCPWISFIFGHCDVSAPPTSFLKAGQLNWSRHNLSHEPTARYVPIVGLDQIKGDGYENWIRLLHSPASGLCALPAPAPPTSTLPLQHEPADAARAAAAAAAAALVAAATTLPPSLNLQPHPPPPPGSPAPPISL